MMQAVLALNTGSSSVKFALYTEKGDSCNPQLISKGEISGIPHTLSFSASGGKNEFVKHTINVLNANFENAFDYLTNWIKETFPLIELLAVGHRVVHGGSRYTQSVRIEQHILNHLESLNPLAPLHQPHNLAGIRILQKSYPMLPQIACFDTSFHKTQPYIATLFSLPKPLRDEGIRRYGFHGLSYQYISETLSELIGDRSKSRVIVAHLGHGASMCALKDQKSITTTMGFTALDGLPMGTRSGTIDPGVILYLLTEKGFSAQEVSTLLYQKSGLLGLSGISDDMRDLLISKNPQAIDAVNYFCYRIQRELGSLVASLEGIDVLVFTGGIGENSALIRQKICNAAKWLNIQIDELLNSSISPKSTIKINHSTSQVEVWVIPTDEEIIIAKDTFKLISKE